MEETGPPTEFQGNKTEATMVDQLVPTLPFIPGSGNAVQGLGTLNEVIKEDTGDE